MNGFELTDNSGACKDECVKPSRPDSVATIIGDILNIQKGINELLVSMEIGICGPQPNKHDELPEIKNMTDAIKVVRINNHEFLEKLRALNMALLM